MPRSGTSLVEQIVSSHPKVYGHGELKYVKMFGGELATRTKPLGGNELQEFRHKYLAEISKNVRSETFVTDKMPTNFRYVSLILSAFPEAKIIHLVRSPQATCWSNFKQYFVTKDLGFCYDLTDLVDYYKMYKELMAFWEKEYPDKLYHLNYDNLTRNQENETRELAHYVGLSWDKKMLNPEKNMRNVNTASMDQVRQKVYSGSSEAWKTFETLIADRFDPLER